jgi:type IV pilus assembly protein PilA
MKKGFSLVELLAIIVLLGLIVMISVPIVNNNINKSKEKTKKIQVQSIIKASKNYTMKNSDILPEYEDSPISIEMKTLIDNKLIDTDKVIDPKSGKTMSGCIEVTYNSTNKSYNYEYVDKCKYYPSTPELDDKMIPIVYRNDRWETVGNTKWYDYDNKEWANAVIVKDYTKYKDLDAGVEVLEDDIVAYFVWIPRYSYTIQTKNEAGETTYGYNSTDIANPGAIDIKFINKRITDNGIANYSGNEPSNYRTSDAFWHDYDNDGIKEDNEQVSGIWIGKFENGIVNNSLCAIDSNFANCNKIHNANDIVIKSNYVSLRNIKVGNHYSTSVNFGKHHNLDYETRMIKASDWGSVLYLSQSIHGRCKNKENCMEIERNDNSNFRTGDGDYKNNLNQSTTGNITGIYDVHGGAWEVTMSFYQSIPENSDIPSYIKPKHYEIFSSTNINTACNDEICYGYSLSETFGWYSSYSTFINGSYPLIAFGGCPTHSGHSGFRFYQSSLLDNNNNTSRILIQSK